MLTLVCCARLRTGGYQPGSDCMPSAVKCLSLVMYDTSQHASTRRRRLCPDTPHQLAAVYPLGKSSTQGAVTLKCSTVDGVSMALEAWRDIVGM